MGLFFILIMIIAISISLNSVRSENILKDRKWIDNIPKELRKRYRR